MAGKLFYIGTFNKTNMNAYLLAVYLVLWTLQVACRVLRRTVPTMLFLCYQHALESLFCAIPVLEIVVHISI